MPQPTRAEINALVARVQALPDLVKFELFDVLRDDLAAVFEEENPEQQKILERKEALVFIQRAAEHLELPARRALKRREFDEVAEKLGWEWNGNRIIRLWERWRLASEAYLGTRQVDTPEARRRRKSHSVSAGGPGKRVSTRQRHLDSLKVWLDTEPEQETRPAYEKFVLERNARLAYGEQPLVHSETLRRGLALSWHNSIKAARGDLTLEEAMDADLAEHIPNAQEHAIVGISLVARILNTSHSNASLLVDEPDFPTPVAHIRGSRAWLYEDVKLYKRQLATPNRTEDELQRFFMDRSELLALLQISTDTLRYRIRQKEWGHVPIPEGAVSIDDYYWLREKVEAWIEHQAEDQAKKTSHQAKPPKK